ncbi:MAG TPA: hypothetical protein VN969_29475 [Streptosporangiaceae bacterium]|nr:hypothetical protein [Streptosporangiaceae bacterium]
MVTGTHEAHHGIFRHDDDLFPEVMEQVFGVVLGKAAQVTCLSTDLTERQPLERRADSVLLAELQVEDKGSKYIVVVEAQTDPAGRLHEAGYRAMGAGGDHQRPRRPDLHAGNARCRRAGQCGAGHRP